MTAGGFDLGPLLGHQKVSAAASDPWRSQRNVVPSFFFFASPPCPCMTPRSVRFRTTRFMISREISLERQLCCADALDTTSDIGLAEIPFGVFQMQQRLSITTADYTVRHDASVNPSETAR